MANVKTLIKKLVNNGYSEDKLSMMTEKEIRDAYKIVKEEIIMKKNANTTEIIDNVTTNKEESTMKNNNTTATNNNATVAKEEMIMGTLPIETTDTRILNCVQGILIDSAKTGVSEDGVLRMVQGILIDAPKLGLDNDAIIKKIEETFKNMINKEESTMTNEMIKVTVKAEGLNEVLTRYGIELVNSGDCTWVGSTDTDNDVIAVVQTPSQCRKGIATMAIRGDMYKTIEKDLSIVSNDSATTVEKEEMTMEALVKRLTENQKVQDTGYIKKDNLRVILNEQFGFGFNNKATRIEMVEAFMAMYKDSLRVADEIAYGNIVEDNSIKEETTMNNTEAVPATHRVICIDHAYYDDEFVAFAGTQEECNDYINRNFTEEDARLGLFSYRINPVPTCIPVGDLSITSDRIYHDDTIIEKAVPVVKVNNPAPDDAKALTYRLMHKIGDHAINNRKKGFGTTVSAWMLCAYILEVKYGMTHLKGHEHEVTDEMKETVKNVRKWLIDNGYIKTVTFKDEKGFVFYTPEYDGNRKDKMYDCTKFQATGKVETTTYRVTKEMNKWYK